MRKLIEHDLKYYRIILSDPYHTIYCDYDPSVRNDEYIDIQVFVIIKKIDDLILMVNAIAQTLEKIHKSVEITDIKLKLIDLENKIIKQGDLIVSLSENKTKNR